VPYLSFSLFLNGAGAKDQARMLHKIKKHPALIFRADVFYRKRAKKAAWAGCFRE